MLLASFGMTSLGRSARLTGSPDVCHHTTYTYFSVARRARTRTRPGAHHVIVGLIFHAFVFALLINGFDV
ncbi:hypothetical protein KR51_00007080 [Rubidibacter lacunae KORDI 51-2]|uniref:Uncharacterized protein n=1 Tax=Rubidibacter lacunae KORDI 51-2 TaxID=582515 RepID=U5DSG2_9CHRO|nr:hypothetical protein KR51_00007080 [Rubidibacter lacunae KORDI 51-2]